MGGVSVYQPVCVCVCVCVCVPLCVCECVCDCVCVHDLIGGGFAFQLSE